MISDTFLKKPGLNIFQIITSQEDSIKRCEYSFIRHSSSLWEHVIKLLGNDVKVSEYITSQYLVLTLYIKSENFVNFLDLETLESLESLRFELTNESPK